SIPTIRNFGDKLTKKSNFTLIRINPTEPQVPIGGIGIDLGAKEALEEIFS
ncbi:MAG: NAD-dependent deacetylase, partial [Epsilonproteobacteria bacterium]|nr:NAD-dependent deacetylase [Campylobacterota bacterium]